MFFPPCYSSRVLRDTLANLTIFVYVVPFLAYMVNLIVFKVKNYLCISLRFVDYVHFVNIRLCMLTVFFGFERGFFRIFSTCAPKKAAGQGLNGSGFPAKGSPRNFPKRNFSDSFFCPMPLVLSSLRAGLGAGKSGEPPPPSAGFSERKEGGIP